MIINGTVRQSCSALVDKLDQPISLEPMTKFPNVRDLVVDRAEMFEHLKRVHAWIELDGTHDLGPGPRMSQEETAERYIYSRCFTCGCCLEACPQYGDGNYIGAQTLRELHRRTDTHAIQTLRHASDRQDDARRTARRHHGRRRCPELQQLKQLRTRLPDVHSHDESDLRGEPRHCGSRLARLAQAIILNLIKITPALKRLRQEHRAYAELFPYNRNALPPLETCRHPRNDFRLYNFDLFGGKILSGCSSRSEEGRQPNRRDHLYSGRYPGRATSLLEIWLDGKRHSLGTWRLPRS